MIASQARAGSPCHRATRSIHLCTQRSYHTTRMPEIATLLEGYARFDPAADFEQFLQSVPARWVVYLFSDKDDRALQLLCVKNLRASLKRRLGSDEQIGPTRAVNYRDVVRHVRWRRVDSAFEADWIC